MLTVNLCPIYDIPHQRQSQKTTEMIKSLFLGVLLISSSAFGRPQQDEGSLDDLISSLFTKSPNDGGAVVVTPATPSTGGQGITLSPPTTNTQSQVS